MTNNNLAIRLTKPHIPDPFFRCSCGLCMLMRMKSMSRGEK